MFKRFSEKMKRSMAFVLCLSMSASLCPITANAEITDSVSPTCDEAYYVKTDSYGNPTDESIVKSYVMNGASSITDYGSYTSVNNLTDSTKPVVKDGTTTFDFGSNAPASFYFEGKTDQPYSTLPWTVSCSYKLNGVPKKAEELAGEKGVVEVTLNLIPNKTASEYMQDNYTLIAAAMFNQDDILSLEAPDAQVETLGNIRAAVFIALPGEEQHYTLRIGSNDFKFDGFTMVMGPLNSGRLSDITDLKKDKEDIQDSYDDFNAALDEVLDSLDDMKGSLNQAADGMDELNKVRENVHSEKDTFYSDFDAFLNSLSHVSSELNPISGHLSAANNILTDFRQNFTDLNSTLLQTKTDLESTQDTLVDLQNDMTHIEYRADLLDNDANALKKDIGSLETLLNSSTSKTETEVPGIISQMNQLYQLWEAYYGAATPADATTYSSKGILATDSDGLPDGDIYYDLSGSVVWTTDNSSGYKTFPQFATEILMSKGATSDEAALYLSIWENKNLVTTSLTSSSTALTGVAQLLSDLKGLHTEELHSLTYNLTDDGQQALGDVWNLSADAQNAITKMDNIHTTLDNYIPEVQSALDDAASLADSLQGSADSLNTFMQFAESIMKKNSKSLNEGVDKTLKNAADILRKTSGTFNSTDKMRKAQDSIKSLIDKKWDKYTGEDNNIFKMDPDAAPISLTSDKNTNITSVSVLIRTGEIKNDEKKQTAEQTAAKPKTTIWSRIGQMFKDIWSFLTGWIK